QLSESAVTPDSQRRGTIGAGTSYAPRTMPILEPEEIALVFGRADSKLRQLVIRAGYAPMILQRAFYDKHEAFAGMAQCHGKTSPRASFPASPSAKIPTRITTASSLIIGSRTPRVTTTSSSRCLWASLR